MISQIIEKIINKRYFYAYAILVFFTPLIFVTNTNELFEFPKMFFVYYIAVFLSSLFLIDWLKADKEKGKNMIESPSVAVLIYIFIFILSVIFSSHLYTSVWGYYTRFNGGLVSLVAFFVIYFVARNKLTLSEFEHLILISLIGVIPVAFYAILQHFGLQDFAWKTDSVERVFSTFGQPNWLAQYFVFLITIALNQAIFGENRKIFWSVVYLLGFSGLWFTYSISGLAGLVVSLLVFVIIFLRDSDIFSADAKKFGLLMFLSLLIAILNPGLFGRRIKDLQTDLRFFISITTVSYAQSDSFSRPGTPAAAPSPTESDSYKVSDPGYIRKGLWSGTWNLINASPRNFIFGTGPETYPYAFQYFRPQSLNYSSEWNFVFNKPHNYYLQIWAESGLLGLVSYGFLIYWFWKKLPKFLIPGLAGFLVTNIFGWPVVATSLIFWLWVAFAEVYNVKTKQKEVKRK